MTHICDIAVIGAGLAGLAAAEHLKSQGLQIKVMEAGNRVGGRVLTHHLPNGAHFELGPFSFGDGEKPLWDRVHRFALPIVKHTPMDRAFWFQSDEGKMSEKGIFLSGEEREVVLSQLMNHFRKKLEEITDDKPAADALKSIGASQEAIEWLQANTLPGLLGNGFQTISTQTLLTFLKQYDGSTFFYAFKGGNDQLPQAIAKLLEGDILFNQRVQRIEQLQEKCILHGETVTVEAKRVIVAIPVPEMDKIKISPLLSEKKQRAMKNTPYTPCARISIIAPPAILGPPRGGVFLSSDRLGWFRDQTAFQVDPHKQTVFNVSVVGDQARRFSELPIGEWKQSINIALSRLYPNWDPEQAEYHTHCWEEGGYSYFPADMEGLLATLREPEGRLHFAGEHTSDQFSSMNGALESGMRAAAEVIKLEKPR